MKCDHIRHQWRGVDLPCATPGCVEGIVGGHLMVPFLARWWATGVEDVAPGERAGAHSVDDVRNGIEITFRFIRENWDGGWGWSLA